MFIETLSEITSLNDKNKPRYTTMETVIIDKTPQTPSVRMKDGSIQITGRSIPEDPIAFYTEILDWLDNYILTHDQDTTVEFNIDLMNTGSSKCLLDLLNRLNRAFSDKKNMKIVWHYDAEDEDMCEMGYDLKSFVDIPFEFKENVA